MTDPHLREVVQVAFATNDLDGLAKVFSDKYGIGPWEIMDLDPSRLTETTIDGQPAQYGMRLARARLGQHVTLELCEPMDDASVYAESLRRHGGANHVHHIMCSTDDYDETRAALSGSGVRSAMAGNLNGLEYDYVDATDDLGIWIEFSKVPADFEVPEPDSVYPPDAPRSVDRRSSNQ